MILRNFLYLDTGMLNDFISTIDGYIEEGTIDQTELETSQKSGKAQVKILEGNLQFERSMETKQKLSRTDSSKFQRLYDYISKNNVSQFLDAFDNEIWNQIKRGELIEIPAKITLPKAFLITQDIQSISPMMELMRALGQEPIENESEAEMFKGLGFLGEQAKKQSVPVIFETESTSGYKFVCQLQRQFIKTELNNLIGECDVIGKVQRIIPKGKEEEVYSLVPAFDSFFSSLNRDQRRKHQNDKKNSNIAETVKGPAMIITPLAIYR